MRVVGYIDGMNFYEASKDQAWYPAGWCNWTQTLGVYCPGAEVSVRYFTSLYVGRDMKQVRRQKLHLLAMEKEAHAEIIFGSCRRRPLACPNCRTLLKCPKTKCGCDQRLVEKMTDVNIAVAMMEDAFSNEFDTAILVSADSDLCGPVRAIRRLFPAKRVVVAFPPQRRSAELEKDATATFVIGKGKLAASQFPPVVSGKNGFQLLRPSKWA